jgi:hypothetical protein
MLIPEVLPVLTTLSAILSDFFDVEEDAVNDNTPAPVPSVLWPREVSDSPMFVGSLGNVRRYIFVNELNFVRTIYKNGNCGVPHS